MHIYQQVILQCKRKEIAMSQFADMWNQGRMDMLLLNNSLIYTNLFLSLLAIDILVNDPDFMIGYKEIPQAKKDLLNFCNYYYRGNEFTIERVE